MKISFEWLSDYVSWIEKNPEKIAERLTLATAEVEGIEHGELLHRCCVGEVVTLAKHPNADKLSLTDVKTDMGTKRVVCGGTNLRIGMKVAFAHVGAHVKWHGGELMTLEPVTIRGEQSEGMICAAEELGIESRFPPKPPDGERPIVDLGNAKTGQSLKVLFGSGDTVFDINNTAITTRPDLWSHLGFAREVVALGLAKWKGPAPKTAITFTRDPLPFASVVDTKPLVPRYQSCIIEINGPGETPDWMKKRLAATGWQSINLPVDITNFVTMDVGMPLHAFDADALKGTVHFRAAKKGEKIVTLDKVEREVPEGGLVLSDDDGVFDLMGIMGGLRSSTTDTTKRIFLHAAVVDPVTIRKTIQATGLRTHAATVYEKGIPTVTAEIGLNRAIELFLELVPGAKVVSKLEEWGTDPKPKSIPLSLSFVTSMLGVALPEKRIIAILESLGCKVVRPAARNKKKDGDVTLSVTPPLWRLRDLLGPQDLLEEIARIHGFENIDDVSARSFLAPVTHAPVTQSVRQSLASDGFQEILPLSLVGPGLLKRSGIDPAHALPIANPLADELSLLQPSTLPQLLEHAERSILQTEGTLQTFHASHVFSKNGSERKECGVLMAEKHASNLKDDLFLGALGVITHALSALGHSPETVQDPTPLPCAHPGRSAVVRIGAKDVAHVFELRPSIASTFSLRGRVVAGVLDLTLLETLGTVVRKATSIPHLPAIRYDVTVKRTHADAVGPLLAKIRTSSKLLESLDVVDLFDTSKTAAGSYNATLRFTYRAKDRTLTEDEAKKEHDRILSAHGLSA